VVTTWRCGGPCPGRQGAEGPHCGHSSSNGRFSPPGAPLGLQPCCVHGPRHGRPVDAVAQRETARERPHTERPTKNNMSEVENITRPPPRCGPRATTPHVRHCIMRSTHHLPEPGDLLKIQAELTPHYRQVSGERTERVVAMHRQMWPRRKPTQRPTREPVPRHAVVGA